MWHEHWHGDQTTITSTLDLTIVINGGTPIFLPATAPSGAINNTPQASLPCDYGPCGVGQQILRTTSRTGNYNDWAYWDVDLQAAGLCDDDNPVVTAEVTASNPSSAIFFNFEGTVPATAVSNITLPDCTPFMVVCDSPPEAPVNLGCLTGLAAFNSLSLTPPFPNDPDADFSFSFTDSAPKTVGCITTIDRTYTWRVRRTDPCTGLTTTESSTCLSRYTMTFNTGGPNIDSVQAFTDYGCAGDLRSVVESQSNVVASDPDNNIVSLILDSESRVTNDCQVTVTRIWEVEDCCNFKDQATETYVFDLTPGAIGDTTLDTLRVGCISSVALIPPPVAADAGDVPACEPLAIAFDSERPYSGILGPCEQGVERVFKVTTRCTSGTIIQPVIYTIETGGPSLSVAPFENYECAGDLRSVADSLAALVVADPDGLDTVVTTNLVSELRSTNDCDVTVTRNWEVIDCCGNQATAVETYAYTMGVGDLMFELENEIDLGCIGSEAEIDPLVIIPLTDNDFCDGIEISLFSDDPFPQEGCALTRERIYQVSVGCSETLVTQLFKYVIAEDPGIKITGLPAAQDFGCIDPDEDCFEIPCLFDEVSTSVPIANTVVPLVNGTTTAPLDFGCTTNGTTYPPDLNNLINDPFYYNPDGTPNATEPGLTYDGYGDGVVCPRDGVAFNTGGGAIQFDFKKTPPLFVDLWGRVDCPCDRDVLDPRDNGFVIRLYDSCGELVHESGPQTIPDDPADAFLRYLFPAGLSATRIEIDGTGIDFFTLQEMRLVASGICAEDVVTTNECDVTVLRTYTVQGCCSSDSRTVPFTYHLTPELTVSEVEDLSLGCIGSVDQIPPFDLTMCVAETTCGDLTIKAKDVSEPTVNGCISMIERTYSIEADCGVSQCVTQVVSYVLNTGPPVITAVAPYANFGCAGDTRTVAASQAALVITDPDGAGTFKPNLAGEVRTTNDCKVTVQRLWEVRDCCGLTDQAIETYEYLLTDQDLMAGTLAPLDLGCIASTDQIPPPDFVAAGTMSSCGELKITLAGETALTGLPACYQGIERVYTVEMPCVTAAVTQEVRYILDTADPTIDTVLPFQDYGCVSAEPRPLLTSSNALVSSDDTLVIATNLLSEVRLTNDCVVTVTRTWEVADCCGNKVQRDETYQYTMQPDAVALAPLDVLDLACIDSLDDIPEPNTTILDATSDCSISNAEHVSDSAVASTLGACYSAIDRTYQVTDLCGGTATVVQRINYIFDSATPTLTVPAFQDYGCVAADPRPADTNAVIGSDDLLVLQTNLLAEAYVTNDCVVSVTRTWQVVDCCDKTAQLDETYQYTVSPGPLTVAALAPLDLRCIDALDDIPAPNATLVDASSDCAVAGIAFVSDVAVASDQGGCYEAIDRTYQVTDLCGGTASVVQRIDYIIDLVPPTIDTVPPFQDYGCVAADPQPLDTNAIVASDADGHLVSTTLVSEVRITDDCVVTVTRNWRVEDCCGKFDLALEIYQYTITPDAPTIAAIDDLDLRCIDAIDDIPAPNPGAIVPSSSCTIQEIAFVSDTAVASDLGQCYSAIDRLYRVIDKCGQTVEATQRIDYILDSSPPEIVEVAPFQNYGCVPADPRSQADSLAALVLSDDHLIVETNLLDEVTFTNDCAITVVRTWQVVDCCDQNETRNETYSYVLQPNAITVAALAPLNLECIDAPGDIPLPNTTIIDATTDCLVSNIAFVSDTAVASDLGACYSAIDRVYEATDRCGGTASVTQRIDYVLDDTDPSLVVPAFVDYGCVDADPRPADTNAIVTSDDLLVLETNLLQEVRLTNDCQVTVTRTWQVVDCCGNTATLDETYRYTERPSGLTVAALAPLDLRCIDALGDIPLPNTTLIDAMSDCLVSNIEWTADLPVLEADDCTDAIDRVYEITDKCGGTASVTQRITYILDTEPPVITEVAAFEDYGCVSEDPRSVEVSSNAVVSSDDHHIVDTNLLSQVYLTNDCDVVVTRLWEVVDCCGNKGTREETYRYTLQAMSPPTIPTIANFDLRCIDSLDDIPAPDTTLVNALSECPVTNLAHVSDTAVASDKGDCYAAIDRVYSATDNCGLTATITQRIDYILDTGDPLITAVAAFEDYGCVSSEPRPLADSFAAIETSDDNLVLATNLIDEVRLTNDCVVVVTRTWQIWDCCSNENTRVETYQYTEQAAAPTITGVNLIELGCITSTNQIPLPSASQFTVVSDCDTQVALVSQVVEEVTDLCIESLTRIYRVTDNCGQSAEISQTFTWTLNTRAPLITAVPPGTNYGCVADSFDFMAVTPPLTNEVVVADDNLISTIWLGDTYATNGCDITVTRLWEVTDCCGSTDRATAEYQYRLEGDGPVITCPDTLDLGCIQALSQLPPPSALLPQATSECGSVSLEWLGDSNLTSNKCDWSITRNYRATDECGLVANCSRVFKFRVDAEPPSLAVSNFVDYGCVASEPRPLLVSSNALVTADDTFVVATQLLSEVRLTNDCQVTVIRIWEVTDCCGRTTEREELYRFTITPSQLTVAALAPLDLNCIDSLDDIPLPNTTLVDAASDCSITDISWLRDDPGPSTYCTDSLDRVYEVTDLCEGTATVTQRIVWILDTAPPTIDVVPPFVDYGCVDSDPRPADTNAIIGSDIDNHLVSTTLIATVIDTNDCRVSVTRTWRVEDCCNKFDTAEESYVYTLRPTPVTVAALAPRDLNCIDSLDDIPQPNTTIVDASSDCLITDIQHVSDTAVASELGQCYSAIDRVYQVTDRCSATAVVTQRFDFILDTGDSELTVPAFVDYGCVDSDPRPADTNAIITADDNLVVATNLLSTLTLTNDCVITVTRTWQIIDCCNNTVEAEETYRYTERPSPLTVTALAPLDLRCIDALDDIPQPDASLVDAQSDCLVSNIEWLADNPVIETDDCSDAIDRVYQITDRCGGTAVVTQNITYILDTNPPMITEVAPFIDYGCVTAEPRPLEVSSNAVVSMDDHFIVATNLLSEVRTTNDCIVLVTRLWEVVDCCGNKGTREETYQFTNQPAEPPSISGTPLIELGCLTSTNQIPLPSASQFVVVSECRTDVSLLSEIQDPDTDACVSSITRVYLAVDNCGQTNTFSQTFTYILNTREPLITAVPPGTNYGCVADSFDFMAVTPPLTNQVVVADDNLVSTIWLGDTFVTNACDVTVTRLWEVTDCCGATDRATAEYQYRLQGEGPTITCPDTLDLGCIADIDQIPEPASITVDASSECGTVLVEHLGDTAPVVVDACRQSVERTYRVTDECGLTNVCTHTIIFTLDNAPPTLAVSNFVDYGCVDAEPRPVLVSSNALVTSDDSSVVATQLVAEVRLTNDCVVTVTRTWEVTDCCNNTTEREETYRFTLRPSAVTVAALAPVDLNCIDALGDIPLPNTTLVQAQSDCSISDIIWLRDDTGPSTYCTDSLDRVYRITDLCGGTATVTQRFTWILDAAPPTIDVVPPFVDYGCQDSDPRPADTNAVIGSDAENHLVSTTLVAQVTVTNDCRVTVTRTWRVEDCCGKFDLANESYAYTLRPSTVTTAALAPVDLGCLDDLGQIPEPNTTLVQAMSDCSVVSIEFVSNSIPVEAGCVTTMERTYRATDLCGGMTTVTQDFSWVLNTLDPFIISAGTGTNYGCQVADWVIPPANTADTNAVKFTDDNVTNVTWLGDSYTTNDCLVTVVRTWEIIDCCNNRDRGTVEYTYTAAPAARPTITCPPTLQLGCITSVDQIPTAADTMPEASSTCGGYSVELVLERNLVSGDCQDQIQRFYTVTDVCGAQNVCNVRILYILDTAPPEITEVPPFVDNGCAGDPRPVPLVNNVIATDDRIVTTVFLKQEIRTTNECQVTVQRIWRAEDCCGNFDERTETYQFTNDPSDPEVSPLAPMDLGCIDSLDDLPDPNTTAIDLGQSCAASDVTWVGDIMLGNIDKCTEAIDRVYLATDLCGGNGSVTQRLVYILDAEPPTILSVAPFIDAGCSADPRPVPLTNQVIATDIEGHLVSTQLVAELRLTNDCKVTVQRTWRVEDCCGKFDTAIETYSYTTIPAPSTVAALAPLELGCLNDLGQIPLPNTTLVSASSDCSIVAIDWLADTPVSDGFCVDTLDRTYRVTDLCGGTTVVTQEISWVLNVMDPIITDAGIEVNFGCQAEGFLVPPTSLSQTNEVVFMDDNVTNVSWIGDSYTTNDCDVTVLRTWQVIDCCGNKDRADVVYTFNIIPPEPDTVALCPDDLDLECITSLSAIPTPVATLGTVPGGCNIDVFHLGDSVAVKDADNCTWSFIRTNLVTDTCGVSTTCSFTIRYKLDSLPPVLAGIPPQLHYGCLAGDPRDVASVSNAIAAASSDPDGNAISVSLNNETVLTNDCEITVTRQWRVTDCCGRVDFGTEVYQYTAAPDTLSSAALAPIQLGCINNAGQVPAPNPAIIDASSDCSITSIDWVSDTTAVQSGCVWRVTRTYEVTDLCGMQIPVFQAISYTLDQNDPQITAAPEDIDYGCVSSNPVPVAFPFIDLLVEDDSVVTNRWYRDELNTDGCFNVLVRTWGIIDCCGRIDEATTIYSWINRPDMPVVGPLADRNLGCITSVDQVPLPDTSIVEAQSDCSVIEIDWLSDTPGTTDRCVDHLDRVYQVTDLCGATAVVTQRFSWTLNTMDPMITVVPPGTDFGCVAVGFEIPAPNTNALVAMDDNLVSTQWIGDVTNTSTAGDCLTTVVRSWEVVDCCGAKAQASASFTYTITPGTPDISNLCPADIDLGCITSPFLIPNGLLTLGPASGDCDVLVEHVGDGAHVVDGCVYSFVRTNRATAVCGVSTECSFTITYRNDDAEPKFLSLPGGELGCQPAGVPDLPSSADDIAVIVVDDSCETQVMLFNEQTFTNGCAVTLVRSYMAMDLCNNAAVENVVYNWTEQPPAPTIVCPADLSIAAAPGCTYQFPDFTASLGLSSDCSGLEVTQNPSPGTIVYGVGTYAVTFTATDLCGATSFCSMQVDVTGDCVPDPSPAIELDKTVIDDATPGACAGAVETVIIDPGTGVTWCFTICNTGNLILENVALTDGDLLGGISIPLGTLPIGACTNIALVADQYRDQLNVAEATGDPIDGSATVRDEDPARVIIRDIGDGFTFDKSISLDGSCPGSEFAEPAPGDLVTFCYDIINSTPFALTNAFLADTFLGVSLPLGVVQPGENIITSATWTATGETIVNTATIIGQPIDENGDPAGPPVGDTNTATSALGYFFDKSTSLDGTCPGMQFVEPEEGDTVTFCFFGTNTGDLAIADVTVADPVLGYYINLGTLQPGEGYLISTNYLYNGGTFVNAATSSGQPVDENGNPTGEVYVVTNTAAAGPAYFFDKTISADGTCPGYQAVPVNVGDEVTFCFTLQNLTSEPLTDITVSDPAIGLNHSIASLPGFETWATSIVFTIVDEPFVNSGLLDLTDPNGNTNTVTNTATAGDALQFAKTASLDGMCPGTPHVTPEPGDTVTFCFFATNISEATILNVSISDPAIGFFSLVGDLAPGEGVLLSTNYTYTGGTFQNAGSVTGTPDDGGPPINTTNTATAGEAYFFDKTISANGNCPGYQALPVEVGDAVTYCFVLQNLTSEPLTNLSITDPALGLSHSIASLPGFGSWSTSVVHFVTEEPFVNQAIFTGDDPNGDPIGETNTATAGDALQFSKTASLDGTCPGANHVTPEPGDAVTFCFFATNISAATIQNVTISDPSIGFFAFVGDIPPHQGVLLSTNYIYTGGTFMNAGSASGTPDDGGPPINTTNTATAGEAYFFDKTISPNGNCPGYQAMPVEVGDTVTYCFTLQNLTSEPLTDITVTDPALGLNHTITSLPGFGSWNTSVVHVITVEPFINEAVFTGTGPDGPIGETNTATAGDALQFSKTASLDGSCPGANHVSPEPGDLVSFCFFATNISEATVLNVSISDPAIGYFAFVGDLEPGQGVMLSTNYLYTGGTFINAASANGTPDDGGPPITTTNTASAGDAYFFDKTISPNGNCPGYQAMPVDVGDTVTYCFTLQNLISEPLTDITVTDPALGLNHTIALLPGFGSWNTSLVHIITVEPFINEAVFTGTGPDGPIGETNTATAGDALQFSKTASLDGSCPGLQHVEPTLGSTVTFCFFATNISAATIQNVTISDPAIGYVNNIGDLGPFEGVLLSTTFTYPGGTFVNAASATGTPDDGGPPITTTNTASSGPAYFFDKTVSTDGTCPGYQFTPAEIGDEVTFCFVLQNLQSIPLTDITIADPAIGLNHTIASLAGFDSWSTAIPFEVVSKPFVNTASLTLTDPNGNPAGETNTATIADALDFSKTVSLDGSCPGASNVQADPGDTVTFCFELNNLSDVPINGVTISDPAIGFFVNVGTLPPFASANYSTNILFQGGTFVNSATASGTPEGGPPISTTNTASAGKSYFFDKTISPNGNCPGVQIYPAEDGDFVTFCFTLQNLTSEPITDITITDPAVGLNVSVASLPGFDTWQTSVVMQVAETPFVNQAVIDLTDPNGNPQTETNAATAGDALFFDKTISLDGSCPGEQSAVPEAGDTVTFCFYAENTSGFPLTNLVLQDPALGLNVNIGTLLPGESFSTSTTWTATGQAFVNRASVTGDGPDGPIEFIDEATSDPFDCCVDDNDPPSIIEAPKGADLGCVGTIPNPDITLIIATDDCGSPRVELLMAMTNQNGCTTMAMHRYRVSDPCGNFQDIDAVWMLTNDTTPPSFTCPDALQIPLPETCVAIVPQITPQTFSEDCGGLEFTQTPAAGSTLDGPGTYEILIMATDACGNQSSCMTQIEVTGVCDSDLEPAITLEKKVVVGHDNGANCANAVDSITVASGTPVTWCFTVVNTGEIMLQNVTITDTDLEPDLQFVVSSALPPGQSASHFVMGTATESLENRAGVKGQPTNGKPEVMDMDTASITVVNPAIDLVKTVSLDGDCPGEVYAEAPPATPITYCFEVTNTGDIKLDNVILDDPSLNLNAPLGPLNPGQSIVYQQAAIISGLLTNVASVTGSPGGLPAVSDMDEAVVSTGLASLSGVVWTDLSNDGNPNNENLNELAIANATVSLYDADSNLVATTISDQDGAYEFTDLLAGEYTVAVDPNTIDPALVNQSTPGAYTTDLPVGMNQADFDFGFLPGATYVELEFFVGTVTDEGVRLDWRFGFEEDSLGYNLFRDGKRLNQQLILAGTATTFLDPGAQGGNYVLQVIDTDLETQEFGPILPVLDAMPVLGPTRNISAADNEALFNTSTNWLNYFIHGFDNPPTATDRTHQRVLKGEGVAIDGESGIYLHAEPDIEVEVK